MRPKKKERTIEEVWTQRNSLCCYYDFCLDAAARRNLVSPGCSLCPNKQDKAGAGLGHADILGCLVLFMMLFEKEIPLVKEVAAQWREEKRLDELEALVDGWRNRREEGASQQGRILEGPEEPDGSGNTTRLSSINGPADLNDPDSLETLFSASQSLSGQMEAHRESNSL
ncbi:MAG: hypothetical protein QMD09_12335 [Desulfatibacillaceae bacterium]|nr:hypothetical protein [Desulfatibacillaceae bacterium]